MLRSILRAIVSIVAFIVLFAAALISFGVDANTAINAVLSIVKLALICSPVALIARFK